MWCSLADMFYHFLFLRLPSCSGNNCSYCIMYVLNVFQKHQWLNSIASNNRMHSISIFSGVSYQIQDNLLYHPEMPQHSRCYVAQPSIFNIPYEVVHIRSTDNVMLHAFWMRQPGEKSKFVPTVLYFHGNAGNIGHRLQNAKGFIMRCGVNVLMVDYRGYGQSTGEPSEQGLHDDARATFNYLLTRNDLDHNQICLFGRSLGGAVAIDLAADTEYSRSIMCVIVENSFTSIQEMACHLLHPNFKYIPICCYKNKVEFIRRVY